MPNPTTYRALRDCLDHFKDTPGWTYWLGDDPRGVVHRRRVTVAALCAAWNRATAPYAHRTEAEHRAYAKAARLLMGRLRMAHAGEWSEDEDGRARPWRRQGML